LLEILKQQVLTGETVAGPVALALEPDEIEALALGARLLVRQGDVHIAASASTALASLQAALPSPVGDSFGLGAGLEPESARDDATVVIAQAIRNRRKLRQVYADVSDRLSVRTLWPVAVAVFEHARLLAAWCELRGDWRHFRLDRMIHIHQVSDPIPESALMLLHRWRAEAGHAWDRPMLTG
jgi:predicted DNA-binding transcriptional regulator YafY